MRRLSDIFAILSGVGVVFVLGSVGALECDNVSLMRGIVQIAVGLAVFIGGAWVAYACSEVTDGE